jgi:hypothetical protein
VMSRVNSTMVKHYFLPPRFAKMKIKRCSGKRIDMFKYHPYHRLHVYIHDTRSRSEDDPKSKR